MTGFLLVLVLLGYLSTKPIPEMYFVDKKPKVYTDKQIFKHEQKVLRRQEKKKYEYSKMPESGYMTIAEYEKKSADILTSERKIEPYEPPRDKTMEYTPQYTWGLAKYNNPPGSPYLNLGRKLLLDRQFVSPGIVSPDKTFLIYPVHNFYGTNQCVTGDLYMIKLDQTKGEVQRVEEANIIKRVQTPILSTSKDLSEKYVFRSLTPVDFSADGNLLLVKEKIGSIQDGIWQTNLWIYNFRTQEALELTEAQETVKYYWRNSQGLFLDEKRWDIFPLGFTADHPDIIIFNAYAYTGRSPMFLGTWSIDSAGEYTELVSLQETSVKMSLNGYKLVKTGIVDPAIVHNEAKAKHKKLRQKKKELRKAKREAAGQNRAEYRAKIKEMKEYERKVLKHMK
ncbi:hypothetical protein IJ732_05600 [bacterium]|nr:hypothetical protein [bacterium]